MIEQAVGFHIEPTNICTLKCPGCARTQFLEQWPQHWKNHSLDVDQLLTFIDVNLNNKRVNLCGNYGDPIYHPDLINFVKQFKIRGAVLTITTNGSYKNRAWWEDLTSNLDVNDHVVFSVDGTPDNFTEYRINANWSSIKLGMEVVANSQCNSTWKFIPFSYNQFDIAQVEKLSMSIGIKNFLVDHSDRFDEKTQTLLPNTSLLGARYSAQNLWKSSHGTILKVNPKCHRGDQHFITAEGYYSPCCFLADYRFYYKNQFGKNKKQYKISTTTLSEILSEPTVIDFYKTVEQQPGCQFSCPNTPG